MNMKALNRLTLSACGMHLADQISLVSVPLIAALVFDASAEIIGLLVAAQSIAHLLGSLPSGLIVDRLNSRSIAIIATLLSTLGYTAAVLSTAAGSLIGFGISVTLGGFGIVLFVIVSLSILPKITKAEQLAEANARIELPRAMASFAVPLTIGFVISSTTAEWIIFLAALGGLSAFVLAFRLPSLLPDEKNQYSIVHRITEGGKFVFEHELLFAITICSMFWNLAFSALLVLMVPLIINEYLFDPGTFGIALSAFGLAAIAWIWSVNVVSRPKFHSPIGYPRRASRTSQCSDPDCYIRSKATGRHSWWSRCWISFSQNRSHFCNRMLCRLICSGTLQPSQIS